MQVPSGGGRLRIPVLVSRIRDRSGRHVGNTVIQKPPAGMSTIGAMTSVGDGMAFFLAESAGSESGAAANCVSAARVIRAAADGVAVESGLTAQDVVLRFGLHWGSTPYVGNITTAGRTEVTALGDEVNEAVRIETCATGGRALTSKTLLERLDADDAAGHRADELPLPIERQVLALHTKAHVKVAVGQGMAHGASGDDASARGVDKELCWVVVLLHVVLPVFSVGIPTRNVGHGEDLVHLVHFGRCHEYTPVRQGRCPVVTSCNLPSVTR